MFSSKSERRPLIEQNNPFYNEMVARNDADYADESAKGSLCSKKLVIFVAVALLLMAGILTSQFFSPHDPVMTPHSWVQMEQGHEHPSHVPKSWSELGECTEDHPFILTLVLKQQNTDALDEHIAAVSHPKNKATFHKYWEPEKVRSYFKPSTEALTAVTGWLKENGYTQDNGHINFVSKYGNVIKVSLTCGQANKLLNTQYMFYENQKNGKQHLRVKDGIYNIPEAIFSHIDFMSPTIRFPLERHTLTIHTMEEEKVDFIKSLKSHSKDELRQIYFAQDDPRLRVQDEDSDSSPNIPARLSALYQMDDAVDEIVGDLTELDSSTCRQSVASFIEQYYSDDDLEMFWDDLQVDPQADVERVPPTQPSGYGSEAELDTQYMTATGKGIFTYVYYVDSDDIFVTLAEQILATEIPPLVVSISYGADEYELGEEWVTRCNAEFGKLALIGTTVLASSGDSGIRGNDEDCLYGEAISIFEQEEKEEEEKEEEEKAKHKGKSKNEQEDKRRRLKGMSGRKQRTSTSEEQISFITSFPASAPYVTAVGGTTGGTIQDNADASTEESAWMYSGGGFSIYFDQPEWQKNAVNGYFSQDLDMPLDERYVATGRGYPDISAQSVDYVIAYDGAFYLVSGTSASSPTVAGMISMINYARIQAGKESLGFLNPALYQLYDSDQDYHFNDVVDGYNIGCQADDDIGFYTAKGWDPITGVGTPKFSRIYESLLALE